MKYIRIFNIFLLLSLTLFICSCQSIQDFMKVKERPVTAKAPTPTSQITNNQHIKVALLLPINAKNRDLGQALYNSAVMSLFDNAKNQKIELFLFDSKDSVNDCIVATNDIVKQGIKLVVGPVFSDCLEAIMPIIKQNNLTVISLSNNQKLLNNHGIFLAGFFIEQQIERSVNYAIARGKKNFAAILPANEYGLTFAKLLKSNIGTKGGNYIAEEFYRSNDKNLADLVNKITTTRQTNNPQIIFVPEAGKNLTKIISSIKNSGNASGFEIVGSENFSEIATLNNPDLIGIWFSAPKYQKFERFEQNYYQLYAKFPPRIASIIYDTIAVIAEITNRNPTKMPEFNDFIFYDQSSARSAFKGIDGLFRFLENGLVERNLAIIQVGNGSFYTIDEPLDSFVYYNITK